MADRYAESWLQLETATGGRTALQGGVSDIRAQFAGLFAALSPGYPLPSDAVAVTNGNVQGVGYRIYTPQSGKTMGPLPLGVFMHGGGFILGDLDAEDFLCREFAEKAGTILISVDYRLAPEHEHPVQLQDTMTIIEWAYANASSLGADANRLFTIGTSAGATLALLSARKIVSGRSKVPATALSGVIAVSPVTVHPDNIPEKFQAAHNSYKEFGEGAPVLTRSVMTQFLQLVRATPEDSSSFILLDDTVLGNFPPVYVSTAECDPLRDDGKVLAAALKDAGVSVHEVLYKGMPHCFWFFNTLPEWSAFSQDTVSAIKWIQSR
ncbi:hypothetical protein N7474_008030 [Penicillium riverlandense]|uniref:uncharacterized protein n=1 Tax=Penicillium riverlandense TaxID=1903569 RepID=UPI002547D1CA|nr:uncharacterized protein N7474_008030 [Penicillium riverlandense]KAJ5811729.1 hypothetical protein N7474_008030 [Penicillium riverlandense]